MGASIADLTLESAEREAVAAQARAFAPQLPSAEGRERYQRLADAAAQGVVPEDLVPSLEALLELALHKRPLAEPLLSGLFARTPRGHELAAAAREVNTALRTLKGQQVAQLHLTAGPGRYALTLETDRVRLSLVLDDAGPRVESAEVG